MRQGLILKGVGGTYEVLSEGDTYPCRGRGRFRREKLTPMVGDRVAFEPARDEGEGFLMQILPRKNALVRPPVANVDLLVLVVAAAQPEPDLLLADRLLAQAGELDVETALVVNKADLGETADILAQYSHLPWALATDGSGLGWEALRAHLAGKITCFAGQSGVGKSTLISALIPGEGLPAGAISQRTRHGRHTTRHVQLLPVEGGYVVDTPGFSLLETELMEPEHWARLYPEYRPYEDECRFQGCLHDKEPGCAVRRAVEEGALDGRRYERYRLLLAQVRQHWKERYD